MLGSKKATEKPGPMLTNQQHFHFSVPSPPPPRVVWRPTQSAQASSFPPSAHYSVNSTSAKCERGCPQTQRASHCKLRELAAWSPHSQAAPQLSFAPCPYSSPAPPSSQMLILHRCLATLCAKQNDPLLPRGCPA